MDLDELRAFIAVAETGSFSAAAQSLDFAKTTLLKRVDQLETKSGVKLLKRAADGVSVTRAGELLAKRGRALVGETLSLIDALRGLEHRDELIGVDVPLGLPHQLEQTAHKALTKAAPSLRFHIRYTDGALRLDSDAKLALFLGAKPAPDPRWHFARITRVRTGLFASKGYLEGHSELTRAEDLLQHRLLVWEQPDHDSSLLPVVGRGLLPLAKHARLVTPNSHLVRQFAQSGDGICFAPASRFALVFGSSEKLSPVLRDEVRGEIEMWMAVQSTVSAGAVGILTAAVTGFARAAFSPLDQ